MVRLSRNKRRASVAALAQRHIDRHFAEERHARLLGRPSRAAFAKNVRALARWRFEVRHVLDNPEYGRAGFFKHRQPAAHIRERHFLRR